MILLNTNNLCGLSKVSFLLEWGGGNKFVKNGLFHIIKIAKMVNSFKLSTQFIQLITLG